MTWPKTGALGALALACLVLAGCASGGAEKKEDDNKSMTKVSVAVVNLPSEAAIRMGEEEKYFADQGIELDYRVVSNIPAAIAAVQGGTVDFAYAPAIPVISVLAKGVPLKVVAPNYGYPEGAKTNAAPEDLDESGLFVRSDSGIASVADLAGKTVAVPARKAQLEITLYKELKDSGVSPDSVDWIALDFVSALESLKNGRIDAAGLITPFTSQAEKEGYKRIASPSVTFFEEGPVAYWITSTATNEKNPQLVRGFRNAILKSNALANDNALEAKKRGVELAGLKIPLDDALQLYWPNSISAKDLEFVQNRLLDLGVLQKPLDVETLLVVGDN